MQGLQPLLAGVAGVLGPIIEHLDSYNLHAPQQASVHLHQAALLGTCLFEDTDQRTRVRWHVSNQEPLRSSLSRVCLPVELFWLEVWLCAYITPVRAFHEN